MSRLTALQFNTAKSLSRKERGGLSHYHAFETIMNENGTLQWTARLVKNVLIS